MWPVKYDVSFYPVYRTCCQDYDVFISAHIKFEKCCYFRNIVGWDTDLSSFVEDVEVKK